MKIVLSQIEYLPRAILFWDLPRLQEPGWRWAPASVLDVDANIPRTLGGYRCMLSKDGLKIVTIAIRLDKTPTTPSSSCSDPSLTTSEGRNAIALDFEADVPPSAKIRHWSGMELRLKNASKEARRLWDILPTYRSLEDTVILLEESSSNTGVLACEYKQEDNISYLHYIALVQRVERVKDDTMRRVKARKSLVEGTWCLG